MLIYICPHAQLQPESLVTFSGPFEREPPHTRTVTALCSVLRTLQSNVGASYTHGTVEQSNYFTTLTHSLVKYYFDVSTRAMIKVALSAETVSK